MNIAAKIATKAAEKFATKISEKEEEFSFWSWFKGLVNPLQNLPLISGIYSSVNSENNESDRDLIQNSLGGFLYGGPFGAIAGFGNWVFNKIFDKTPTELALDATGISNIWKEEDKELGQTAKNNNKSIDDNKKLHIQYSGIHQTNDSQKYAFSNVKTNEKLDVIPKAPEVNIIWKSIGLDNVKNNNVEKTDRIILKDINKNKNFTEPKVKEISIEGEEKFREINFSYPQWTPGEDENSVLENKPLSSRIKYLEIENSSKKRSINFNA